MARAVLDATKNFGVHEGLAQSDQHHVLGRAARFLDQPVEDLVRHIFFRLLVGFTRAHGAVEIAFGGGLDDVLDRLRAKQRAPRKISPQ